MSELQAHHQQLKDDYEEKSKAHSLDAQCLNAREPLGAFCHGLKAATDKNLDHKALFDIHRKAMAQAIHKAMNNQPSIDWLLENQDSITHKYYQMGLDGKI